MAIEIHPFTRGEDVPFNLVAAKIEGVVKGVAIALAGTWDEEPTKFAPVYPYNQVFMSESNHITEIDNTPGAERLHWFHRAGTFEEWHPNGIRVLKVVHENYEVIMNHNYLHIQGHAYETAEGNHHLLAHGNRLEEVDGFSDTRIGGNCTIAAARIDLNP